MWNKRQEEGFMVMQSSVLQLWYEQDHHIGVNNSFAKSWFPAVPVKSPECGNEFTHMLPQELSNDGLLLLWLPIVTTLLTVKSTKEAGFN